mgnify:CR=1 FL=1
MNLILDPWVPIRDAAGTVRDISPLELASTEPAALELAALRPDFNGALAQFLIGLWQLVAPENAGEWQDVMHGDSPLPVEHLRQWAPHFEFDSGDRRFMQDMQLDAGEGNDLDALLLESPGANALRNNSDLFIKRCEPSCFGSAVAAQALICLQMNAPAGGQGHRTSLRGGGPVSYLWWPQQRRGEVVSLWQKLWANVQVLEGPCRPEVVLPWISSCLTSEDKKDALTQLVKKHGRLFDQELAALCYFATPRRIQLTFVDDAQCSLSGRQGRAATGYVTRNFGADYRSGRFRHPLSPYYTHKEDCLPAHLSEVGFSYLDWLQAMRSGDGLNAPTVLEGAQRSRVESWLSGPIDTAIWAFGYKMDNMKCEAWHEARYPVLTGLSAEAEREVFGQAKLLVAATNACRLVLRKSLRRAWSDEGKKGDTSAAERQLLSSTEFDFYAAVRAVAELPDATAEHGAARQLLRLSWQQQLRTAAFRVFDTHAQSGDARNESLKIMQRIAGAQKQLGIGLHIELPKALDIAIEAKAPKQKSTRSKAA